MGHVRLGKLPKTREWRRVVELLGNGADTADIAAAVATAAEKDLIKAQADPAFVEVVWILTQLPIAARSDISRFALRLRDLGFPQDTEHSLNDLISGFHHAVASQVGNADDQTDLGELARQAAAESLSVLVGDRLPGLFENNPDDLRIELRKFVTKVQFARLARDFFARLTHKTLDYYLSRVLADHIGPDRAFETLEVQAQFKAAVALHCREASEIVEQFAGGWYAKSNFNGTLNRNTTQRFAAYALEKMRDELRARRADNA